MADSFLRLSATDRRDVLEVAGSASGRPVHLLEKDVWVVWALQTLFEAACGPKLVFKGGTSLSKAYGVIRRFSEDVDLTYDIRAIAPDLVTESPEALPATRSQERKWTREIKIRLDAWVQNEALANIASALAKASLPARARAEDDKIHIEYEPLAAGTGYVRPAVMLEFGARSTGEPWEALAVVCDAAAHMPEISFPIAAPRVMRIERTFWAERQRSNMLMVHYNDLKADRSGEMRRIAEFLGIETPPDLWPQLVAAADFATMKRHGATLLAPALSSFKDGHNTFLHQGTNDRWQGVLTAADVALYRERMTAELPADLIDWLDHGRLRA